MGLRLKLLLTTCAFICVPLGEAWAPSPGDRKDCKDPRDFTDLKQGPYPHQRRNSPSLSRWVAPSSPADQEEAAAATAGAGSGAMSAAGAGAGAGYGVSSSPFTPIALVARSPRLLRPSPLPMDQDAANPARTFNLWIEEPGKGNGKMPLLHRDATLGSLPIPSVAAAAAGAGSGAMSAPGAAAGAGAGYGASSSPFHVPLERMARSQASLDHLYEKLFSHLKSYLSPKERLSLQATSHTLWLLNSGLVVDIGVASLKSRLLTIPGLRPDRLTPLVFALEQAFKRAPGEVKKALLSHFPVTRRDAPPLKTFFLQPHELVHEAHRVDFLLAPSPPLEHPFLFLLKNRMTVLEKMEKSLALPVSSSAAALPSSSVPAASSAAVLPVPGVGASRPTAGPVPTEPIPPASFFAPLLSACQSLRTCYQDYGTTLCRASSAERRKLLSGVRIQGEGLEASFVPEDIAYRLLSTDFYALDMRGNATGVSPVASFGGIHFKRNLEKSYGDSGGITTYTLQPGLEWSMYSFSAHLFGQGIPPSMFLTVSGVPHRFPKPGSRAEELFRKARDPHTGEAERETPEEILNRDPSLQEDLVLGRQDYLVQASKTIPGKGLDEVLKTNPSLNNCDLDSFSALVLMTLLTNPADAKADNFIVTTDATGKHSLTSIDNDYALANMIAKREREGHHFLESKSILFCLRDLMKQPLGERIRKKVLAPLPQVFMLKWLKSLQVQNARYQSLRQQQGISPQQGINSQVFERLSLPLKFHPGVVKRVVQNFIHLQETLRAKRACSHEDLLSALYPSVALHYQQLAEAYPNNPVKAYDAIHHGTNQVALERTLDPAYVLPNDERVEEYLKAETVPGEAYKDRTQSIEESVLDFMQTLSLDNLPSLNLHSFLETAIHLFPEQAYRVTERSWLESSLLVKVLPYRPSFPLVQYLLRLNPEESLKERETYPDTQNTPLHLAVLHAPYLLHTLIAQRADPEVQNKDGQTPLDLAMVHRLEPAFVQLITEGAGIKANPKYGLPFYKTLRLQTPSHAAFMALMTRNPAVEWEVALDTILPPKSKEFFQSAGVTLQGARMGSRILIAPLAKQLLTSRGEIIRCIQRNHLGRKVGMVETSDKRRKVYFKEYPELPGFEEAVGLLTRQILGFGAPYTELLRTDDRPVLASQGIHGPTLRDVLETQPHLLQQLDHESLASMMLMAMLLNPEDGKPDNYIFEELPFQPGKYRLIGVDNDHAFVPGVAKEQRQLGQKAEVVTQAKTILFCFEEMYRPVPPQTRERFLKIDAGHLLDDWLKKLGEINLAYQQLFEDFIKSGKIKEFLEIHDCYVGMPFVKDMVSALFDKITHLQDLLHAPSAHVTPMDLLKKLEPHLGDRYDKGFRKYKTVFERFKGIDGGAYGAQGQTITRGGHILNSIGIPAKESVLTLVRKDGHFDPNHRFALAIKDLAHIRKQHQTVVLQKLSGGKMSLEKPEALTPDILSNILERLDLSSLSFSDQGSLLDALKGKLLKSLTLRNARLLRDEWFITHQNLGNLKTLCLQGCRALTRQTLSVLGREAPLLESLIIERSNALTRVEDETIMMQEEIQRPKGFFSCLKGNVIIRRPITIIQPLGFAHLRSLNVSQSKDLTRINLIAPHLEWLNASDCPNLESVTVKTSALQNIYLANTSVTNETSLALMAHNPQLKQINLKECINVGTGIQKWGQDLAREHVDLGKDDSGEENEIGEGGAVFLGKVLKVNKRLAQLDLRRNKIGDEGARSLAEALKVNKSLTHLGLGENYIRAEGVGYIAEALKFNKDLTQLDLNQNRIGAVGAEPLAEALKVNKSLTRLDLCWNQLGDTGAGHIAEALKINQFLTQLDLSFNNIGDEGAGSLAKALKLNNSLTRLNLQRNGIGKWGVIYIASALKVNQCLTQLDLGYNEIGDGGVIYIASALKVNQGLTQLDLKDNQIGGMGAGSLADPLKVNKSLTLLDLGSNKIEARGGEVLVEALKINRGLTHLNLNYNKIGVRGAEILADALKVNRFLTRLDLWGSEIGKKGVSFLADVLKAHQFLTCLGLSLNQIGEVGAGYIAEVLKVNQFIVKLDLRHNQIGAKGAGYIAEALKVNRGLIHLNLSSNWIENKGAGLLAEALKVNGFLIYLNLYSNAIIGEGVEFLKDALKVNKSLTKLALGRNDPGPRKDIFEKNEQRIKKWIVSLCEPLKNALLGRAPDPVVLTQRGNQPLSLIPVMQVTSPGTAQSQFSRETLHLILSYIPPFNLKEWFEQSQKTGLVKGIGKDPKKDNKKDDKKDNGKDSGRDDKRHDKKDDKKDDRSDRKFAPFVEGSQVLRAAPNQPLMTAGGEPLYEFLMSGENSKCSLDALGFQNHDHAREFLLAHSHDVVTRRLIVPEIRADLAAGEVPSRFIANNEAYRQLNAQATATQTRLNNELQRLSTILGLQRTASTEELQTLQPQQLTTYNALYEAKKDADKALESYLSSEAVFTGFVNASLRDGRMQSYLVGAGQTTILNALAYNLKVNLTIMGRNNAGTLEIVHEYRLDNPRSTRILLHTNYQDAGGRLVVGGTPGTVGRNNWNHFNLLSSDEVMTVERVGSAKPGNSEATAANKDK